MGEMVVPTRWERWQPFRAFRVIVSSSSRCDNLACETDGEELSLVRNNKLWDCLLVQHCFRAKSLPLPPSSILHPPASSLSPPRLSSCISVTGPGSSCQRVFHVDAASWAQENRGVICSLHEQIHSHIKYVLHNSCKDQFVYWTSDAYSSRPLCCMFSSVSIGITFILDNTRNLLPMFMLWAKSVEVWWPWSASCLSSVGWRLCCNKFLNYDHNLFLTLTKTFS